MACASTPSMPDGGTALTSAAISNFVAPAISAASSTRTPAFAAASTTSVAARIAALLSGVEPSATARLTPNLRLISAAWRVVRSVPSRATKVTDAPSSAAITADAVPTTPVAPKTETAAPRSARSFFSFSVFSTTAIIAAAVVNEPAGSANSEISNGLNSALPAASSMSRARSASLPPMKTPVRTASRGERENMASWIRSVISPSETLV